MRLGGFWADKISDHNQFGDEPLLGWYETGDGCWSLMMPGKLLPQAVVCPVFSVEEDEKWQAHFYGHGSKCFETKEQAMGYATALVRIGGL